ncbi:hypothetical protein TYRP_004057 [Tyrophagus putrescentiae]|nr:hypothetical protein TYRP_004057 [Tyrophagus putrescentiae]
MQHQPYFIGYLLYHLAALVCLASGPTAFLVSASGPADELNPRANEILPNGNQRPLYNIAHMCNSITKTASSLARGANAVEVDVTFRPDEVLLYHGYPCDCFRYCWDSEPLGRYLEWARHATLPGTPHYNPGFVVLYFDVKLTNLVDGASKYKAGLRFARHLERSFFELEKPVKSTLKLVVSISYVADVDFLKAVISRLREVGLYEGVRSHLGFDVGMDTDSEQIAAMWRRLNVSNVWQGEGITNCVNPIAGHQLEALTPPKSSNPFLKKVYRWTIDLSDSIRSVLSYGVDGVMTNHPERVVEILREPSFKKSFRMATVEDDPFERFRRRGGNSGGDFVGENTSSNGPNKSQQPHRIYSFGQRIGSLFRDLRDSVYHFVYEVVQSLQSSLRK